MALARWQATITNDDGDIIAAASVEVTDEATGGLATLYSDRAGATPISNPATADADGFVYFHVAGGAYKIIATSAGLTRTWRYVGIGTSSEEDKQLVTIADSTFSNQANIIFSGLDNYSKIEIELERIIPVTDG